MPQPFSLKSSRTHLEGGALLALIGLLCALAVLQYRWLGTIAEAERRKLTEEATEKANAIAQDIDRELTRVFLELRIDGKTVEQRDGAAFSERFERWRSDSAHQGLVKAVMVAEPVEGGPSRLLRFDPPTRAFNEESWPDSLLKVRDRIDSPDDGGVRGLGPAGVTPVMADVPALVFPVVNIVISQRPPPAEVPRLPTQLRELFMRHAGRGPVEIVVLDAEYLKGNVVGQIAEKRLGPDAPFLWSVVRNSDGADVAGMSSSATTRQGPDAKVPLLRVRFDDLDRSLLRGALPGVTEFAAQSAVRFVVQLGTPTTGIQANASHAATAPWSLMIRHKDGSIDAAVRRQQIRNTALSASILGVLGLSAGLVFFSARRLRAIATQQVEFVAAMSHELRTPLAVIRSAADNLADGVVDGKDQAKRYGALIRDESVRLADMVEHVLEFAGADSPERAARGPVDAIEATRSAVASMATLATERGASVEIEAPGSPLNVKGDLSHLTRAISNLIGNALKYGGDAPQVAVNVKSAGDMVEISVADRGSGLATNEIPHLFEPFYRGRKASEAQIPGSGLGLALVKRIVESHGGRVSAANSPSGGALFTIVLPSA